MVPPRMRRALWYLGMLAAQDQGHSTSVLHLRSSKNTKGERRVFALGWLLDEAKNDYDDLFPKQIQSKVKTSAGA